MARHVIWIIVCLLGINTLCHAQQLSPNKKAVASYNKAADLLNKNQLEEAAKNLEQAISHDQSFVAAYQQLGDIYRRLSYYPLAVNAYKKVLEIDENLTPLTYFGLGEASLFSGDYKSALSYLTIYSSKTKLEGKSKALVTKYLSDANFALGHPIAVTSTLRLAPGQLNTEEDEYFPQLTADNTTIIFTRKKNNQENFYESTLLDNAWPEAIKLEGQVNSDSFNEGAHCITPDGKYLFFTGCNRPNGFGSCDIYVSKKENGKWSEPFNLGAAVNTRGWEAQPSISADGKTLYFVSNRPGGQGGYDLWKTRLKYDGNWDTPTNLGPSINTPYDEGAPYIHADNKTLFFSSNGWPGFGKKDIFRSELSPDEQWSIPQNLGFPINNHFDQLSMHVSMDGKIAHLASQDENLQLDIYTFEMPKESRPHPVAFILGTVQDAISHQSLVAKISVTKLSTNEVIFEDESDLMDGQFLATLPIGAQYAVHVQKEGYLFDSKQYNMNISDMDNKKFEDHILLKPIADGNIAILNNVYFDTNKSDLLPQSKVELDLLIRFLTINPLVTIELSGHTDNTGNKNNNQELSEKRAQSVVDYLIQQGIAPSRLKPMGYGDSHPIGDNSTIDGRQINRRTEVKILKK